MDTGWMMDGNVILYRTLMFIAIFYLLVGKVKRCEKYLLFSFLFSLPPSPSPPLSFFFCFFSVKKKKMSSNSIVPY